MDKKRYAILDILRGLTLISMIAYHAVWDLVYLFGVGWDWYKTNAAYVWQQSICWSFIILSGFCWNLGKKKWRRGFVVFVAGTVISVATYVFMPDAKILFGVLTFLGSAMMLFIILDKVLRICEPTVGAIVCAALFVITRNINDGELGFESLHLVDLPDRLYRGWFANYLGFTQDGFWSMDYFPLLRWIFLFAVGYFLYGIFAKYAWFKVLKKGKCAALECVGKHSLLIYMLHQPLLYGLLWLVFKVM